MSARLPPPPHLPRPPPTSPDHPHQLPSSRFPSMTARASHPLPSASNPRSKPVCTNCCCRPICATKPTASSPRSITMTRQPIRPFSKPKTPPLYCQSRNGVGRILNTNFCSPGLHFVYPTITQLAVLQKNRFFLGGGAFSKGEPRFVPRSKERVVLSPSSFQNHFFWGSGERYGSAAVCDAFVNSFFLCVRIWLPS